MAIWKTWIQEGLRAAAIMGAGDVIAQTIVENRNLSELHIERTLKYSAVGFFFVGPTLRFWYGTLEKLISPKHEPIQRALRKMAIDQLAFSPIFSATFIGVFGKVNGESNQQIVNRLKNDYPGIVLRSYMLWPAAQVINFSLVPLAYQVTFAQIVAVIWNVYLSMALNKT